MSVALVMRASYRVSMKRIVVGLALVLAVTSCNKLKSGATADGGASADPAASGSAGLGLGILNGFEGEIGLIVKGSMAKGGAPQQLTTDIKGDKVRVEMPAGMGGPTGDKGFIVFSGGEKKLTIVDDTKKQAMVIDLNKQGDSPLKGMASRGGSGAPKNPPKVTKTGKTDTVAGYKCEIWQIDEEGKGKVGEVCVAQDGFSWLSLPASHLPIEHGWAIELMDGKHFPLRFVGFENGAESGRIEVTRIDKKTIAPSVFEVPAGYRVVDLSQMMQGIPSGFPSGMTRPNIPRPPTH
jgi:hypothetical protein